MTTKDRRRFEELEKRVKDLEARPVVYPAIVFIPTAPNPPAWPQQPWNPWPTITYGDQTVQPFMAPGTFTC